MSPKAKKQKSSVELRLIGDLTLRVNGLSQSLTDLSQRLSQHEARPNPLLSPQDLLKVLSDVGDSFRETTRENESLKKLLTTTEQTIQRLRSGQTLGFVADVPVVHSEDVPSSLHDIKTLLYSILKNGNTARVTVRKGV